MKNITLAKLGISSSDFEERNFRPYCDETYHVETWFDPIYVEISEHGGRSRGGSIYDGNGISFSVGSEAFKYGRKKRSFVAYKVWSDDTRRYHIEVYEEREDEATD